MLTDLLAALALVLVFEGLVAAILGPRLPDLAVSLQEAGPERVRWAGLAVVAMGTGLYLLVRG